MQEQFPLLGNAAKSWIPSGNQNVGAPGAQRRKVRTKRISTERSPSYAYSDMQPSLGDARVAGFPETRNDAPHPRPRPEHMRAYGLRRTTARAMPKIIFRKYETRHFLDISR